MIHLIFSSPKETAGTTVTRRTFLQSLLASWAYASSLSCLAATENTLDASAAWPAWLSLIIQDPTAVIRFGITYLAMWPEEQEADHLMRLIEKDIARLPDIDSTRLRQPGRIAHALKRRVRTDYVNDDTVNLEGWILSRTEARLYALVATLHSP